jgi:peptide/nickel transport system substrate-binding protein
VGGASVLALAGCGGDGGDGGGNGGGGRLTIAQAKSPIEFDPVILNDVPSAEVADRIFEAPYRFSPDLELVPVLASDQPEIERSGKRWIVPLNGDATFQNGDPVTAPDVAYSYTAPLEEETENAGEVNMIDSVEAVDETTAQFDLKFEFGAFKWYLSRSVVPESVREEDKEAFNKENPVGSGPFTFEDWSEGEFVEISRYDDDWGDPLPNLQTVEFTPVEEGTSRITTLESGESSPPRTPPRSASGTSTARSREARPAESSPTPSTPSNATTGTRPSHCSWRRSSKRASVPGPTPPTRPTPSTATGVTSWPVTSSARTSRPTDATRSVVNLDRLEGHG